MKQTKPFGKAYVPTRRTASREPDTVWADTDIVTLPYSHQSSADRPPPSSPAEGTSLSIGEVFARTILGFFVICLLAAAWVEIRDDARSRGISAFSGDENTVMKCARGKVSYAWDDSILARLLDRGTLICTDWSVLKDITKMPSDPRR